MYVSEEIFYDFSSLLRAKLSCTARNYSSVVYSRCYWEYNPFPNGHIIFWKKKSIPLKNLNAGSSHLVNDRNQPIIYCITPKISWAYLKKFFFEIFGLFSGVHLIYYCHLGLFLGSAYSRSNSSTAVFIPKPPQMDFEITYFFLATFDFFTGTRFGKFWDEFW